jgi:hypothetical protein
MRDRKMSETGEMILIFLQIIYAIAFLLAGEQFTDLAKKIKKLEEKIDE